MTYMVNLVYIYAMSISGKGIPDKEKQTMIEARLPIGIKRGY